MKKNLVKILSVLLIACVLVVCIPTKDVSAYTCYADMTYDEVCAYWSVQPAFVQLYLLESGNSGYSDQVKYNQLTYFKCSLHDSVWNATSMRKSRPNTYTFMRNVLSLSSPDVYNVIIGKKTSDSLRAILMDEMKKLAPYLTYNERCQNADILLELLKKSGITTVEQYNWWKSVNGGRTAFEVFIDHVLDYNDYWAKINQQQMNQSLDALKQQQEAAVRGAEQYNQDVQQQMQEVQNDFAQQVQDQQAQIQQNMENLFKGF